MKTTLAILIALGCGMALLPAPSAEAAGGKAAADACAKGLPGDSRMIYDATVKAMTDVSTLRDTVTAQTRSLVMAGKISQSNARPAAEAAGTCLKMLAS